MSESNFFKSRKIAIKPLAILQTCDLPAILRYRRIFAPHRIGDIRLVAKMASASSGRQLAGFPKNQSLFLGKVLTARGKDIILIDLENDKV